CGTWACRPAVSSPGREHSSDRPPGALTQRIAAFVLTSGTAQNGTICTRPHARTKQPLLAPDSAGRMFRFRCEAQPLHLVTRGQGQVSKPGPLVAASCGRYIESDREDRAPRPNITRAALGGQAPGSAPSA